MSQFALLALAYSAAVVARRRLLPVATRVVTPRDGAEGIPARSRPWFRSLAPLLLPVLAFAFTAAGEEISRSLFGSGEVIAFGKRVFLFIAARIFVRDMLTDPFLRLLGRFVLVPLAALNMMGLLDPITQRLAETAVELGDIRFSALGLIRGVIAGALLFRLWSWSNRQAADCIKRQEDLRPATRELAVKAAEVAIFSAAFLLLMQIMGIDLTAVSVLGGALGVGIGLGLQQIAANFGSGIILLVEGHTTVGDFVEFDGGRAGTVVEMTARTCIIETVDGRRIVVPNENVITSRIANSSGAGKAHRRQGAFPVESCVNGIGDRTGTCRAPAPFAIRHALGAEAFSISSPRRVVELRGAAPAPVA